MSQTKTIEEGVFVKGADFKVVFLEKDEDGEMRERTRKIILDPSDFTITMHQRHKKHVGMDGRVTNLEKVGRPSVVIVGTLMMEVEQEDGEQDQSPSEKAATPM